MGRAYTHSAILKSKAEQLDEILKKQKSNPNIQTLLVYLEELKDTLEKMATDWRLPEELYNNIAKKLNKKKTQEVSDAYNKIIDFMEDLRDDFVEYWEDKDEPRQFNVQVGRSGVLGEYYEKTSNTYNHD